MMDGLYDCWPLSTMQSYFDTRMLVPCNLAIGVTAVEGSSETSGTLAFALATDIGFDTEATINAMLTESGVPGTGTYGSQPYNYGLRQNLFTPQGQTVVLGPAPGTILVEADYEIDPSWDWDQLYLTAFVQSPVDDEVLNSHMVKMSDLLVTGFGEGQPGSGVTLMASPSPTPGILNVVAEAPGQECTVRVYSIDGRLAAVLAGSGTIELDQPGVYLLRLSTDGGASATRSVVVVR